jgi:hypothetical protein
VDEIVDDSARSSRPSGAADRVEVTAPGELEAPPRSWLTRQIKLHAYIWETVLLIGVMVVLNLALIPARPGFLGIEPNPFFAVILLMVLRYGFRAGLLSSVLAAAVYMALVATRIADQVIAFRDLMQWQYAKPAVLFLLVGVPGGMLVQRHRNRVAALEQENDLLVKDNLTLKRGEEELRDVNVELANRVIGATDTLPMLYKYAKKLNNLDVGEILTVLTELVVEVIKADQTSVYRVEGTELPLHSRNGQRMTGPALELEPGLFDALVAKREVLSLHDLLQRNIKRKDLFLCGALAEGSQGKVIALLVVEDLEFLRYNPATIRLFHVIVDWASASLEKASQYRDKPEQLRMVQAKRSMIRAQRASIQPGVVSADQVVAAGEMEGVAKPDRPLDKTPTVISGLPASMPVVSGVEPMRPVGTGPSALSDLLSQAESSLFSELAATGATDSTVEEEQRADPRDRALLQHMLSGELQIASAQGTPLAKLLNEIDGYMTARKGGEGQT